MINNDIYNIFNFSTFSLGYFQDPVFRAIFENFCQNAGFVKYPREKVEKQKMLKMLKFIICEAPQKFQPFLGHFWPFLPYFTQKSGSRAKIPLSAFPGQTNSCSPW